MRQQTVISLQTCKQSSQWGQKPKWTLLVLTATFPSAPPGWENSAISQHLPEGSKGFLFQRVESSYSIRHFSHTVTINTFKHAHRYRKWRVKTYLKEKKKSRNGKNQQSGKQNAAISKAPTAKHLYHNQKYIKGRGKKEGRELQQSRTNSARLQLGSLLGSTWEGLGCVVVKLDKSTH